MWSHALDCSVADAEAGRPGAPLRQTKDTLTDDPGVSNINYSEREAVEVRTGIFTPGISTLDHLVFTYMDVVTQADR